ncbi:MAG: glyoxalase [Bacteroidota bacterium]|jgi:predicted enzyme related to lactoylglutathione lyase|nr:glyoxalase [Bacteroidota bacterium]
MKKSFLIACAICLSFGLGFAFNSLVSEKTEGKAGKVTGIGGVFFKCKDPKALKQWYSDHLGMKVDQYGTNFEWFTAPDSTKKGTTQWGPFKETTKYFLPSTKEFMINYRIDDMNAMAKRLKEEGVTITDTVETFDYGKFLHIMDLEGNKIELWEPIDKKL